MKRNLNIGSKINDWVVISDLIIINNKNNRKLKCKCGYERTFEDRYLNRLNFSKSCRSCSQIERRNNDGLRKYNEGDILMNIQIIKIHSGKKITYTVKCLKCGNTYHTGHSTLNKKSNGFGLNCCHKCFNVDLKKKKFNNMLTDNISLMCFNKIKHQSELRGILFDLTPEYLETLFTGFCYLCGEPINIGTYKKINGKIDLGSASLDRKDSNKGYVEGNVEWCLKDVNIMKNNKPIDDFIILCEKIFNHNNIKNVVL